MLKTVFHKNKKKWKCYIYNTIGSTVSIQSQMLESEQIVNNFFANNSIFYPVKDL